VHGIVLDKEGRPASTAAVGDGIHVVACDEHGEFRLPLLQGHAGGRPKTVDLIAVAPGALPVHTTIHLKDRVGERRHMLRMRADSHSLQTRVLKAAGQPLAGAHVSIVDPAPLGRQRDGGPAFVEQYSLANRPFPACTATTDQDGHFELNGLDDRRYSIRIDTRAGQLHLFSDIRPMTAPESLLMPEQIYREHAGHVLRLDGRAVAGASIWIEREICRFPAIPRDIAAGEGASLPTRTALNASQFTVRRTGVRDISCFGARGHSRDALIAP
jgi:hypothetical protein